MRFSSGLKVFVIMSCMAIACLVLPGLAAASRYYVDPQTGNAATRDEPVIALGPRPGGPVAAASRRSTAATRSHQVGRELQSDRAVSIDSGHYSDAPSAPITIARLASWARHVVFNGGGAGLGQYGALIQVTNTNYVTLDGASAQGFDVENSTNRGFEADGPSESNPMQGLNVKNMRVYSAASYSFYLHSQGTFTSTMSSVTKLACQ